MEKETKPVVLRRSCREVDKLLADFRSSGLTPKRWCQQRGIGTATLQYWLKREREDAAGFSLVPVEVGNMALDTGFLDMSVNGVKMQVWWAVT